MPTPATSPRMVGRGRELLDLQEAHEASLTGVPRGAVVAGEAGIGKTRLLEEFVSAFDPEVVVARGQCVAMGTLGTPFGPVRGVLRDLVRRLGADAVRQAAGPAGHLLGALLPELLATGDQSDGAPGPEGPVEVAQEQLHDLVSHLLTSLSRDAPVVVLIEDLHWADVPTLDLLRSLLVTLREGRLTVVLSYRTDDVGRGHPLRPVVTELGRSRGVVRVDLRRLTPEEAAEQARLIRGVAPDPEELELLVERSEGVPFFVEELLGLDPLDGGPLPETLRELVLSRYDRLTEPTQAVLRLLSTGGVSVPHGLFELVHDGDPDEVDACVREAVEAQVLTVGATAYTFRHALTQEAVHDELLPGERARFHARYAAALQEHPRLAGSAAEVAHHFLAAHDLPRGFAASVVASREAAAAGAPGSAARLGERALELWGQVPDPEALAGCAKADLFLATATAYDETGDDRAVKILEEALAECPRDDRRRYSLLLHESAVVWHTAGRPGATDLCRQAVEMAPEGDGEEDRAARLRVQVGLGVVLLLGHDLAGKAVLEKSVTEGRDLVATAADEDVRERARFELVRALCNLGGGLAASGDAEGGLALLDEALEHSGSDVSARLRDAERRSAMLYDLGRYEEGLRVAVDGQEAARRAGRERGWGLSIGLGGILALLATGRLEEAERELDRMRRMRPPWGFVSGYAVALRAQLHLLRDEVDEAGKELRDARSLLDGLSLSDVDDSMAIALTRAQVALAAGDLTAAWGHVRSMLAVEPMLPGFAPALLATGAGVLAKLRAEGLAPDGTTAADAEQRLRAVFGTVPVDGTTPLWRAFLEAELSGPDGTGTDVDAWRAAVDAAATGRMPVDRYAHALQGLARALLDEGDRPGAAEALRSVRRLASAHGLLRAARLADELAAQAGLGPRTRTDGARAGVPGPTLELTDRERQVLELVAEGLTNRQIGERLFISDKTASVHVSAILRKLGVTSRTEAAVRAADLLAPTDDLAASGG